MRWQYKIVTLTDRPTAEILNAEARDGWRLMWIEDSIWCAFEREVEDDQ